MENGYGGYKKYAVELIDGKIIFRGFGHRDCVDFMNDHNLSDADFRIISLI